MWVLNFDGACEPINPGGTFGRGGRDVSEPLYDVVVGRMVAQGWGYTPTPQWGGYPVATGLPRKAAARLAAALLRCPEYDVVRLVERPALAEDGTSSAPLPSAG